MAWDAGRVNEDSLRIEDLIATSTAFTPYHHGGRQREVGLPVPLDDRRCPNCDKVFTPARQIQPFCTPRCQDTAKAIRYARRSIATYGQPLPPEIHEAVGVQIAHVLAGGYREALRRVPPVTRKAVFTRDKHRCTLCKARPGHEIDHVNGDSSDLTNLRLLCRTCHRQVTRQHLHRLPDDHPALLIRAEILRRIAAATPLRPCDANDWPERWRAWTGQS